MTDWLQCLCCDQTCVDQVMSGGLIAATATIQEQIRLGAQRELRAACGHRAQNRPLRVFGLVMTVSEVRQLRGRWRQALNSAHSTEGVMS